MPFSFSFLTLLFIGAYCRCRYDTASDLHPFYVDTQPVELGNLDACQDFVEPGKLGCCREFTDVATKANIDIIDSVFGAKGGGCDICAINLKRFWCNYACSARQDTFMDVGKQYEPFPDPTTGGTIMGQRVDIRVHVDTACALFNSCKRVPFVAAVSAMSSPAGFLNFQGHNSVSNGFQYISVNFSYNMNDSLALWDGYDDFARANLSACNTKAYPPEFKVHNFTVLQNCSCNSCEQACSTDGFNYYQPSVMEGFNAWLVVIVYGGVAVVTVGLTVFRYMWAKKKKD